MSNSLKEKNSPEPVQLDMHDATMMAFWSKELNIPAERIQAAIKAVGPLITDVKRYLQVK
jgi:hypothetical protein